MTNEGIGSGIESVRAAGYGPPQPPGGGGYGPGQPPGYGGPTGYGGPPPGGFGAPPGGYGPPQNFGLMGGGFPPQRSTNGLAVASMVLGILGACGIFCYGAGGLLGILAIIFGAIARTQITQSQGLQGGKGMATAGLVLGCVVVGLGVVTMLSCLGLMAVGAATGAAGAH